MITASIHESVSQGDIISWMLDLSECSESILNLSVSPLEQVIWQEWAKKVLKNILEELVSGVNIKKEGYNKPIASMIFAGPSWVWKTLLARVTQEILNKHFNNNLETIKINCADFAWENVYALTRLTWASAGFIGSDRKPIFHPDNVEGRWRVILFDEIEKAGPAFWNILLSILDDGTLDIDYTETNEEKSESLILEWREIDSTEVAAIRAFFSDSVIIMTSNVWNDAVEKEIKWQWIWFWSGEKNPDEVDVESIILEEFAKQFRIEMQGRFDYIVPFEHLSRDNAQKIIQQLIDRLITNTLSKWNGFIIEFSQSVKQKILDDICESKEFRRFWWRAIEWYFKKEILPYVARAINSWKFREEKTNNCLLVTEKDWNIVFSKLAVLDESIKDTSHKVGKIITS